MPFHFKCRTAKDHAPILTVAALWEAEELRLHPDYDEVDEHGLPVAVKDEDQKKKEQIFFGASK